jgi:hypothetical protein
MLIEAGIVRKRKREKFMNRIPMIVTVALILAGCETPTTQRYSISPNNDQVIRALNTNGVSVGPFTGAKSFDLSCRAVGALQVADGMTHVEYIQRAFEDELKVAGALATASPRVSLTGLVDRLEFSSTRGLTGGSWNIDLTLTSSNGKVLKVSEYYEFKSGFSGMEACRNTAEAFLRAVQDLVGKAVGSPDFPMLVIS